MLWIWIGSAACLGLAVMPAAMVFAPRHVKVERAVDVDAPPDQVFALIDGFSRFNEWSPWFERDPRPEIYAIEGPETGVGAKMSWASDKKNVGAGTQEVVEHKPGESLRTKLTFAGFDRPSHARLAVEPRDGGSRVRWTMEADMGGPGPGRIMGLMMDKWVGADYEKGLAKLKDLAEREAA